ncbi:BREX system P-loop protein BrxC [Desulfonatronum parangueonense]
MNLRSLFQKPVDRPIEGVIKADDEESLRLEVEEYVLTNEVEKRLERFLDAYNNYQGANGVWVSGFFGSGKSHLLKMLALLLENRIIDGMAILDLFLPKCDTNEILRADLKRAVGIPSKSILFNIDQKADVISKTQIDALLAVFVKVFDEMCGYYGKHGHIAQFERDLDSRDLYAKFKAAYEAQAGRSWFKGREQAILETKNIAKAYSAVTGSDETSSLGILEKYRAQYKVSIEDFAENVKIYLDKQGPDFRLNFFVDEVGQFIAGNVKLMTNLQTIAESLATKCRGRSWVIVTAQEELNSIVGEMSVKQGNDFSKIMARFPQPMKLTSQDVAEVIQRRLLTKNEPGVQALTTVYHDQSNNFKTFFAFVDGSATYRNYRDRDHFIHSYPFIPYQFALFQSAIQNLSQHSAFEGRHSSVGERSMLGVFQQVAIQIGDHQIGQLATFDLMFEGIRTALKSTIQKAVLQAENQMDNTFAVRLLKTLFLVKYVKEFKPTIRNLCVLMLDSFDQDLPRLRKQVEEALNILEQQTYIQRNGDFYEYLTDEEKDVEQEIKNTEVEAADVAGELEKIIFDQVLKTKKIRFTDNGQDYPFSRKLDDKLFGKDHELAINVITPFHEHAENEANLRMQSMIKDELLVIMPSDDRLMRDVLMYKRTEKYIRQNISITQQDAVKRILTDKSFRNRERLADIQHAIQTLLGKARMLVGGKDLEIGSEDAQPRIFRGFHALMTHVYPNLRMLKGITYTENDIAKCLKPERGGLIEANVLSLSEAEQEVLAFIQVNSKNGIRTSVKSVLEKFERKSYGWYYAAILCVLAKLCARGKIEVRTDSNSLEGDDLERALRNTHGHTNLVLEPQVEFPQGQIRALKKFYEDFFDVPPQASEARSLAKETGEAFKEMSQQLTTLTTLSSQYPFLTILPPVVDQLKGMVGKPYAWYLADFPQHHDDLLDLKESIIDPVRKFMGGPQKDIYNSARAFIKDHGSNFSYIQSDECARITELLGHSECFKGNRMQQTKSLLDALQTRVTALVQEEIDTARETIATLQDKLRGVTEFSALSPEQQAQLTKPFDDFLATLREQQLIAVVRESLRNFENSTYPTLLAKMDEMIQSEPAGGYTSGDNQTTKSSVHVPLAAFNSIKVPFDKAWLVDKTDVERYLEAMRKALLAEISSGKRIQI